MCHAALVANQMARVRGTFAFDDALFNRGTGLAALLSVITFLFNSPDVAPTGRVSRCGKSETATAPRTRRRIPVSASIGLEPPASNTFRIHASRKSLWSSALRMTATALSICLRVHMMAPSSNTKPACEESVECRRKRTEWPRTDGLVFQENTRSSTASRSTDRLAFLHSGRRSNASR